MGDRSVVGHLGAGRRSLVALALVVMAGAGCSLAFQPPTVSVAEVRLTSLSLSGGVIQVRLDVVNPNRYALESQDFRYALAFAEEEGGDQTWVTMAEGRLADVVRIPAEGSGSVAVDVPFNVASVGSAVGRLLRRGELEYRFTGALRAGTPLGSRTIPFDQRGIFRP